jgi:hypothetical protein
LDPLRHAGNNPVTVKAAANTPLDPGRRRM